VRTQITVLISDSTKMHCDLLRRAFWSARNRFKVVAYASSAGDVINALQQHRPQVAVISSDLQDGPLSGLRIVPEIRRSHPETKILVVMAFPTGEMVIDAFRSGAVGVFTRNGPFDLLCKSIEVVSGGQIWATSEELHQVLGAFAKSPKPRKLDTKVESRVTRREADVVRLAVEGLSNREIALQLALTEHTVKNYLFRVFDKLGVSNRVELVLFCLNHDLSVCEELPAEKELIPRMLYSADRKESSLTVG
jgi:two-component system, NarL family, nitrate/nitrite response regulator NarL